MEENKLMPKATEVAMFYDTDRLSAMGKVADAFFKAGCFGKDVQNAYQALVKIQAGFEMGLPPMEAMNSLYIVNGHISMWGMAMARRLRQKGWIISYEDKNDQLGKPISCTATIKKGDEVHSYAANANELKKTGAFSFAPKEKLRWHALGRLIRFEVPEVLDAGVQYLKEEAEDFDYEPPKIRPIEQDQGNDYKPFDVNSYVSHIESLKSLEELEAFTKEVVSNYDRKMTTLEDVQQILRAVAEKKAKILASEIEVEVEVEEPPKENVKKMDHPLKPATVSESRQKETHSDIDECVDPECPIHGPAL